MTAAYTETHELQILAEQTEPKGLIRENIVRSSRDSRRSNTFSTNSAPNAASQAVEEVEVVERWNYPRRNIYRLGSLFWGFVVFGMNDGVYGALVPYIETYYNLSYTVVSLVFLAPFVGYTLASLLNNMIHERFGQRGVAIIAPSSQVICYIALCQHPPYPVVVVMFLIAGFGNGLADGAWNAWIGPMANSSQLLGILHSCYGLGATIAPLIATTMITKAHLGWWCYYYLMIGIGMIELIATAHAFWPNTAAVFRRDNPPAEGGTNNLRQALFTAPSARIVWLLAVFLLAYMGGEVGLGGWIVTFMIRVRGSSPYSSGMTATGYWLGLTVGRLVLGFVTPKIGDRRAIVLYLIIAMAMQLIFWLVHNPTSSAVAVGILGFSVGPLFPTAIVVATRLLPKHLHVTGIAFACAAGGIGASVLPFAIGALAERHGVSTIPPFIFAIMAVELVVWLLLPKEVKKRD